MRDHRAIIRMEGGRVGAVAVEDGRSSCGCEGGSEGRLVEGQPFS